MESFSRRSEGLGRRLEKNIVEEEEGARPPVHQKITVMTQCNEKSGREDLVYRKRWRIRVGHQKA